MPLFRETTVETSRLLLRSMRVMDIDPLLAIFADPVVMAAFDAPPFDRVQMAQWMQRNLDHQTTYGYGLFSVILKTTGLIIGNCGLEHMKIDSISAAELGYDFRSDCWNRGYATEAAVAVRDYAFQQLGLPRLISFIRQTNVSSQRVAQKIGMQCVEDVVRYDTPYYLYALDSQTILNNSVEH